MGRQYHRRHAKTQSVRLSEIEIPKHIKTDPALVRQLIDLERGIISAALTRLDTSEIATGFYTRIDGVITHTSNLDASYVDVLKAKSGLGTVRF